MPEPKEYRHWISDSGLVSFNLLARETDLYIRANQDLSTRALAAVWKYRTSLEQYIERHPFFLTTLEPYSIKADAPPIVQEMAQAAGLTGVGPMAAVAGAIAENVGKELLAFSSEIIVENGGDIFLKLLRKRLVGIYAGNSPFTGKIALEIEPETTPLGICTSSGTVGHSLSLGKADAAIVLSPSTSLADAAATAIGNRIKEAENIPDAIQFAQGITGLTGVVIIIGDRIGLWGDIKISPASNGQI